MFEVPVDKQESKLKYERVGISILVLLMIAGAAFYFIPKQGAKQPAAAAAVPMNKDPMGTTAVWLVTLQNKSSAYTYSNVRYETNYIGPDDKSILVNQGSIPESFSPGDEHNSQIRDTLYPNGTAWYKFKIVDAKSSVR